MKLYEGNNGQFYGTQANAKAAVGKHNFIEVDVPTDKWGLISYLNHRAQGNGGADTIIEECVGPKAGNPVAEDMANIHIEPAKPSPAFERAQINIRVEDEIAKADFPNAVRLAAHATDRVAEHLKRIADDAAKPSLSGLLS